MFVAWVASRFSYAAVLGVFSIAFVIAALIVLGALREDRSEMARTRPHDSSATPCVLRQSPTSSLVSGEFSRRHSRGER